MLSKLFHPHRTPRTSAVPFMFFALLASFTLMLNYRAIVGLVGIGTLAIVSAGLVIANRERIRADYHKAYKKRAHPKGSWYEPRDAYYRLNIYIVWPGVALLGALCLWAAWQLSV